MPFFIFILSLIIPLYSFPLAVKEFLKVRCSRLMIFSIALTFAAISFSIVPDEAQDLYRHYLRIDRLKDTPSSFSFTNIFSGYFIFDIYARLLNSLGLPKELLTATTVFSAYFLILSTFNDFKKNYLNNYSFNVRLIVFLMFLLGINYISLAIGLRSALAYALVFYGSYNLFLYKKYILYVLCSFFGIVIHPSAAIPVIIVLISYLFPQFSKHGRVLVILSILFMVGSRFITPIIEYLDSLARILPFYNTNTYVDSEGQWGAAYAEHASLKGWIATYIIKLLPVYLGILYLVLKRPKYNDPLYLAVCLCILYIGLFFSYQTFSIRLSEFYIHIFTLFLAFQLYTNKNKRDIRFSILYIIVLILIWILNLYSFSHLFISAKEVLYKPLPFILFGVL